MRRTCRCLGNGLASLEADNLELDEAGLYDVLATLADVDPTDLCRNCFPKYAGPVGNKNPPR